jgi:phosphoserine phosphatase RsbU/P
LLFDALEGDETRVKHLESGGPLIGMVPGLQFDTQITNLGPCARLLLFSDGVFEIEQANGEMWKFDEFVGFVCDSPPNEPIMDRLLSHVQRLHGSNQLEDDFSIAEAIF